MPAVCSHHSELRVRALDTGSELQDTVKTQYRCGEPAPCPTGSVKMSLTTATIRVSRSGDRPRAREISVQSRPTTMAAGTVPTHYNRWDRPRGDPGFSHSVTFSSRSSLTMDSKSGISRL